MTDLDLTPERAVRLLEWLLTRPRPLIVVLANQKGGVGKTTLTMNWARAAATLLKFLLARELVAPEQIEGLALRVLTVDADPQSNLSLVMAATRGEGDEGYRSLATVLNPPKLRHGEQLRIGDLAVATKWDGVMHLPAGGVDLKTAEDQLTITQAGREYRLREALTTIEDAFEFVFVDLPPSLGQLTVNGLTAADVVVVVTTAGLFGSEGMAQLMTTIGVVRDYTHKGLRIGGVIVNDYRNTVQQRRRLADIEANLERLNIPILGRPLPHTTEVVSAQEAGAGLDEWGSVKTAGLHEDHTLKLIAVMLAVMDQEEAAKR